LALSWNQGRFSTFSHFPNISCRPLILETKSTLFSASPLCRGRCRYTRPDYTISGCQVFCEAALAIIDNKRDLGVLCLTHSSSREYRLWMTLMRENVFTPHSLWPQYWLDI
jgi:hypothetical protein